MPGTPSPDEVCNLIGDPVVIEKRNIGPMQYGPYVLENMYRLGAWVNDQAMDHAIVKIDQTSSLHKHTFYNGYIFTEGPMSSQ